MKNQTIRYIVTSGLLWIFCLVTGEIFFRYIFQDHRFEGFFLCVSFSYLICLLGYFIMKRTLRSNPVRFVPQFLLRTSARIFLYFLFMLIWGFIIEDHHDSFFITMICLYILFSVFEIKMILTAIKNPTL